MTDYLSLFILVFLMPFLFAAGDLISEMARRRWPKHFVPTDVDLAIRNLNQRLEAIEDQPK